jgi:hypothetical protein
MRGENPQLGVSRVTESVAEFAFTESDELPQELNPIKAMAKAEIRVKRIVFILRIYFTKIRANLNEKNRTHREAINLTKT